MSRSTVVKCDRCQKVIGETEPRALVELEIVVYPALAQGGKAEKMRAFDDLCTECTAWFKRRVMEP